MSGPPGQASAGRSGVLESWKEIASYLRREPRTVQRWEKEKQLPVHRDEHGAVYALVNEIDAWRQGEVRSEAAVRRRWRWAAWAAAGAVAAGAAVAVLSRGVDRSPADRLEMRRLWHGSETGIITAVSPDGRYVARRSGNEELAIEEIGRGGESILVNKAARARVGGLRSVVFSPDSRRLAYSWNQHEFDELRVIGVDGSGSRTLFADPDVPSVVVHDWSPDGRYLLVHLQRTPRMQLAVIPLDGGAVKSIVEWRGAHPHGAAFLDADRIVYDRPAPAEPKLHIASLSRGGDEALSEGMVNEYVLGSNPWGIVFVRERSGTYDVWLRPRGAARTIRPIWTGSGRIRKAGLTPDGKMYFMRQSGTTEVRIARLDRPDPGAALETRTATSNRSPDFSPDGAYLAYLSERLLESPRPAVVIHPLAGGKDRIVWPRLDGVSEVRWWSDNRTLLVSGTRGMRNGVFLVDAETGETKHAVATMDSKILPRFAMPAPDSSRVYFKEQAFSIEPTALVARDLQGGKQFQLLPSVYRFSVCARGGAQEGERIAWASFDANEEFVKISWVREKKEKELYRYSRTTGPGRITSIEWQSPHVVLFSRRGELWRLPVQGGPPEKVGIQADSMRDLRVHPDGKRLAYTSGRLEAELWVASGFDWPQP